MKSRTFTTSASALLLLATTVSAKHGVHEHLQALHHRHHNRELARSIPENAEQGIELRSAAPEPVSEADLEKRGGQCAFPYGDGLVPVTPGSSNAGWAMSPDQPCTPGNYCPYACPPGQVSVQWDPTAISYTYPKSMNGGLYCDNNGNMQKPFPNKPYCQATATNIGVQNNAGQTVSFCQTLLPGNEAMLIPTAVNGYATLAVPDTTYWAGTAAHYYINPPGVGTDQACVWGSSANPYGNWAPYVAGANVDASGNTFIKLGWNPIYLEPATPFRNTMPNWGVKIDCPNGGCNGLPCAIDPTQNSVNQMVGGQAAGAGGGDFCVVTVSKGSSANFVVFNSGGSQNDNGGQFYQSSSAPATSSSWSSSAAPTSSWSASSSESSSWSSSATHSWSMSNHTASHSATGSAAGPTGPPSYTLFPTSTGESAHANTATASPTIQSVGTGAAVARALPATGLLSSLLIAAIAYL